MAGFLGLLEHLFWLGSILGELRRSRRMLRNLINTGRSERCGTQVTTHNSKWSSKISTPRPWKIGGDAWKLWVLFSISKSKQKGATSSSAPAGSGLVIGYGDWADKCFLHVIAHYFGSSCGCNVRWYCACIDNRYVHKGNSGTHYGHTVLVDILYTCLICTRYICEDLYAKMLEGTIITSSQTRK